MAFNFFSIIPWCTLWRLQQPGIFGEVPISDDCTHLGFIPTNYSSFNTNTDNYPNNPIFSQLLFNSPGQAGCMWPYNGLAAQRSHTPQSLRACLKASLLEDVRFVIQNLGGLWFEGCLGSFWFYDGFLVQSLSVFGC